MRIVAKSILLVVLLIQISVTNWACSSAPETRPTNPSDNPGLSQGFITHKGLSRRYHLYVSKRYTAGQKHSLVFVLHGGGTERDRGDPTRKPGEGMWKLTGKSFDAIADKEAIIVVYPDGINARWNDGRAENKKITNDADDIGFISALIDALSKAYSVDPKRIYATGFSNGAVMAFALACQLGNRITAVAPVDGTITDVLHTNCSPSRPVPVLMIHGKDYPQIMKTIHKKIGFDAEKELSDTLKFWREFNSCDQSPKVTNLPDVSQDGTTVKTTRFDTCKNNAEVILYAVEGGGHTWPGGVQYLPEFLIGKTSHDFSASEVIWDFFRKHTLSAGGG